MIRQKKFIKPKPDRITYYSEGEQVDEVVKYGSENSSKNKSFGYASAVFTNNYKLESETIDNVLSEFIETLKKEIPEESLTGEVIEYLGDTIKHLPSKLSVKL